jgi:hypothetical protein
VNPISQIAKLQSGSYANYATALAHKNAYTWWLLKLPFLLTQLNIPAFMILVPHKSRKLLKSFLNFKESNVEDECSRTCPKA